MKIWERQSSIRLAQDMSKCLDAGAMTDGDILQLWTCNGLPQQRFGYDENMGTVYLSSSTSTSDASKCIDVTGGSLEAGTNLEVNDCTGCWNQQFSTVNSDSLSFLSHRTSSSNTGIQSQSCPPKPTPPAPPSPTPSPSPWPAPPSPPPSPYLLQRLLHTPHLLQHHGQFHLHHSLALLQHHGQFHLHHSLALHRHMALHHTPHLLHHHGLSHLRHLRHLHH